jgi:hypothetical protein
MQKKYIIKHPDSRRMQNPDIIQSFGPSKESIEKILQFSACYRAQSICENHFVALTLN